MTEQEWLVAVTDEIVRLKDPDKTERAFQKTMKDDLGEYLDSGGTQPPACGWEEALSRFRKNLREA